MVEMIRATEGRPGCRQLTGFMAITIQHFSGDTSARDAVQAQGLTWSNLPGDLTGHDPWLAWSSPKETIAVGFESQPLLGLLHSLAPGRRETAMAADVSEASAVFELHGLRLDDWLAHLVDAIAIPREAGRVTRGRLADAPALLLRLAQDRLWLVVDRPIAAYLNNWLAYAHEGAFAVER